VAQTIVDCRMGLPDRWGSWLPGDAVAQLRDVVDPLADAGEARLNLEEAVLWCDERYAQEEGLIGLAVWVPDAATGVASGVLATVVVKVPPGPEPAAVLLEQARRPPRERGMKVLSYNKVGGTVNAGPLVLELLTIANKAKREVIAQAIWTIVPPGADSAVVLNASTGDLPLLGLLVAQGDIISQSVEVDLGPAA